MTGLDLGNIQRLFDRAPVGGDPDVITGSGPHGPRNHPAKAKKADIIWNRLKPCCGGEIQEGEDCDCAELAAQLEQANRHPILLDLRRAAA